MKRLLVKSEKVLLGLLLLLATISFIAFAVAITLFRYQRMYFGGLDAGQVLFLLHSPSEGSGAAVSDLIWSNAIPFLIIVILASMPILGFMWLRRRSSGTPIKSMSNVVFLTLYSIVGLFIVMAYGMYTLGFYTAKNIDQSTLYQDHYVDPKTVTFRAPEAKRNLVVIYLESMENTVAAKTEGGARNKSLIPELVSLTTDDSAQSFSHTDTVGGAQPVYGTTWTAGSLTAMTTGVPLIPTANIGTNDFGQLDKFLPGAHGIGDVLQEHGYNQAILMGSEASFGGRDKLFSQHGNFEIYDVMRARQDGFIPKNYDVWWGYEDSKLFAYAQQTITELARDPDPFHVQLLTVNTHFVDGYLETDCATEFAEQYANVYACSSKQVAGFVSWLQAQDFYENTTVVITGDHLGMQTEFYERDLPSDYTRTIYNTFINTPVRAEQTKSRIFTTLDMYPSMLTSIGLKADSTRLGLGTDLFSGTPTLAEQYGLEWLDTQIQQPSDFYTNQILN